MIHPHAQRNLRRSVSASLVLHLLGLGTVLAWSWREPSPRFAGEQQVIQLQVSQVASAVPPDVQISPADEAVEVTPHVVHLGRQSFTEAPRLDVPLDQMQPPDHDVVPDPIGETPVTKVHSSPPIEISVADAQPPPKRPTALAAQAVNMAEIPPQSLGTNPDVPPDFSNNQPPRYPDLARQRGWEGTVLLRLKVEADGRVSEVEVVQSSGHAVLDAAAVMAIRSWRGQPAKRFGKPAATVELLPVRFRL